MNDNNRIWWTDEAIEVIKTRFLIDGPNETARKIGVSRKAVVTKARRLGLEIPKGVKFTNEIAWTEEMDNILKEKFPTEGNLLSKTLGVPIYTIQHRARKLGVWCRTRTEMASQTRMKNNSSCDIHYFDQWSPSMAWTLGFMFADGSVTKSHQTMIIGISQRDEVIINFIKEQIKYDRPIYTRENSNKKDGSKRLPSVYMHIRSKILVGRLIELGIKPRKTYNDDPFPTVPDEFMSDFIRGYLDGDGTIFIANDNRCHIGFVGSPKFITGVYEALVRMAGVKIKPPVLETRVKTPVYRISWTARADLEKLRDFLYPPGHGFCLERKKKKLFDWFEEKHKLESLNTEQSVNLS